MVDFDADADRTSAAMNAWLAQHRVLNVRDPEEARRLAQDFNSWFQQFQKAVRDTKFALDAMEMNYRIIRDKFTARYYELLAERR